MSAIFLSDVHLKDATSVKAQLIIRFLQQVASRFEKIYILGDLFDVWPGTNEYLVKTFQPVLRIFAHLVRDGHQVHYIEGNHDFRLGPYFTEELGVRVHTDALTETWGGQRIYMVHGDLANPHDKAYPVLRSFLRQDYVHRMVAALPPQWIYRVGDKASRLSRGFQKKVPPDEGRVREIYRQSARQLFESGYDVVIMGHTHLPDQQVVQVKGRHCRYYNLGDWVRNFTYLEFDGCEFYTKTHPVKDL